MLLLWILVTLLSTAAMLALLAFDEWQVRSRAAQADVVRRNTDLPTATVTAAQVPQLV